MTGSQNEGDARAPGCDQRSPDPKSPGNIDINRDKASALGVTAQQIEDALCYAYGSRQVSTIYAPNNQYQVIIELDPRYQADPQPSRCSISVPLPGAYPAQHSGDSTRNIGPLTVNHLGQLPAVTISFNLTPGVSLGDAVKMVEILAAKRCRKPSAPASRERPRHLSHR